MSIDTSDSDAEPRRAGERPYHHGDLRNGLLEAARAILEEQSLSALTLRAVARRAGVSHAAPYRHFPNHEALLVELSVEGFQVACDSGELGRQQVLAVAGGDDGRVAVLHLRAGRSRTDGRLRP